MNLYFLYMPDSSRCIVGAIFHRKCKFSIFLVCHWKISNNFFWVISKFILAKNCTEFIVTSQMKMYISTFIRFWKIYFSILKDQHFPVYQLVEGASKPRRGARFGNIRKSASHHDQFPPLASEACSRLSSLYTNSMEW